MTPKKKLLITFDYELFLGKKSGSVKNCLIRPTEVLRKNLNKYSIRGIFFVDTLFLCRLNEQILENPELQLDFDAVKNQLKQLYQEGHYIYPHIHPHWLDASFSSETRMWTLNDLSKYRFHSLSTEQRATVFSASHEILVQVLEDPHYTMDAYRAGGWSIQPFADFKPFFNQYKILADFTVLGDSKRTTDASIYDFSKIRATEIPYQFTDEVTEKKPNGDYWEFPISSVNFNCESLKNKLIRKFLWRTKNGQNFGDGSGVQFRDTEYFENTYTEMVAIELLTINKLRLYRSYLSDNNYMQFICHPKMISIHNMKVFDKFLQTAYDHYSIESDWKNLMTHG